MTRFSISLALSIGLASASSGFQTLSPETLKGPGCVIVDSSRSSQVPLAPVFTRVNTVISDGVAQTTMIQSFVNPLDKATEIAYVFPLPEKGAVHAMSFETGGRLYRATIQEKVRAQTVYDSIRSKGGQAAILLQERPNVFQQKMANLPGHDTVHVEIQLTIPLKYVDGSWEFAFPTMVGERYQSAGASGVVGTISGWNPPATREGPEFLFNVLVKDAAFDSVYSPTHPMESMTPATNKRKLAVVGLLDSTSPLDTSYPRAMLLKQQHTYPNSDFVLRLHRAGRNLDVVASSWKPLNDIGHFHLAIHPDLSVDSVPRPPLDLVLLVDRSGSQSGWPMDREKEIALRILERLTPADRVTVIAFDDAIEYALGASPVAATAGNVATAGSFIQKLSARGGTLLLDAVKTALNTPISGDMQRLFVFLTDGFITNEAAIIDTIQKHSPQPQVLTFGCGGSLNRYFLEEVAAVGGGFATLLTSTESVVSATDAAWGRIEAPQVNGLRIDFPASMGARDLVLPATDRLYKGLPLVVDGKYATGGRHSITLRGQRNGAPWTLTRPVDFTESSRTAWAVPKMWARAAIGALETDEGTTSAHKDSIIALSVAYQVLSKYTAFLATVGVPVEAGNSLTEAVRSSQVTEVDHRTTPQRNAEGLRVIARNSSVRFQWKEGSVVASIRILDMSGSLVCTLHPDASTNETVWNGRTDRGTRALPGHYVAEVRMAGSLHRQGFVWMP